MFDQFYNDFQLTAMYDWSGYWMFIVSLGVLALEAIRLVAARSLSWNMVGDSITNFITLYAYLGLAYLFLGLFYLAGFYYVYTHWSIVQLPTNMWTILACIILADLTYYWEHRMMHRVNIGWATHTVHHSSPYFNISVAYRFGPLDGFLPFFFHLPLVLLGFNPLVVFLSESLVQLYQTLLHTELVKKLPRPIEAVMNTPSHHRVHHGSNKQYHDKNYAGIFIIWDRLFGTFAKEEEKVTYGITTPINSVNPFVVFFHGLTRISVQFVRAKGFSNKLKVLFYPPGWSTENKILIRHQQ